MAFDINLQQESNPFPTRDVVDTFDLLEKPCDKFVEVFRILLYAHTPMLHGLKHVLF